MSGHGYQIDAILRGVLGDGRDGIVAGHGAGLRAGREAQGHFGQVLPRGVDGLLQRLRVHVCTAAGVRIARHGGGRKHELARARLTQRYCLDPRAANAWVLDDAQQVYL